VNVTEGVKQAMIMANMKKGDFHVDFFEAIRKIAAEEERRMGKVYGNTAPPINQALHDAWPYGAD